MSGYPGVKIRTFRAPDEVWNRAKELAHDEGYVWSDVLRGLIEAYIAGAETRRRQETEDDDEAPEAVHPHGYRPAVFSAS